MESRLYEEGYNESLLRAVAALNETPASTEAILGLLQKHWDLPRGEAEQLLSQERYEGFFQRDFARYLTMYEGFSEEKARESIAAHKTSLHLSALPTKAGLRFIVMPAEQFKSTLTRACWCKLLNCSGARFLRNFAKKPCTLKRITF